MFSVFRRSPAASGPSAADADCLISREYYSELLNHMSKNWEALAGRNYTDCNSIGNPQIIGIFSSCKDFPIL